MARPLKLDLKDRRFGRLYVIERCENDNSGYPMWLCQCDCGNKTKVRGGGLRDGKTSSCGCWRKNFSVVTKTTHGKGGGGKRRSSIYAIWNAMKQRCHNPNQPHYYRYGGRGIQVCQEWRDSFEAFYAYMGDRPEGKSIDRINNDGDYEPGNCRWATRSEQQLNTRGRPKRGAKKNPKL